MSKKILILSWELYPVYCGGLGILVRHLVNELREQGNEVTILIPNSDIKMEEKGVKIFGKKLEEYKIANLIIENLDFPLKKFNLKNFKKTDNKVSKIYVNNTPELTSLFAFAVNDYLKENEFDLILGMDWLTIPTFCLLKNQNKHQNFAFYINGTEFDRNYGTKMSKTSLKIHNLEKRFYKQANQIFAVSNVTKNILTKELRCNSNKIKVIHNDSEVKEIVNSNIIRKDNTILFLGRLAYQKGLKYLIQSFRKLTKINDNAQLLIVGDGEEKLYIEKYIQKYNLKNKVKLIPWVDGEVKKNLYLSSTLFMMPSVSEPFGLTALEAIRHGVPILASNRCGFCDIVPSTPTFNFKDTKSQAQLMNYFLENPTQLNDLLSTQKIELSTHSWSNQVKKILN